MRNLVHSSQMNLELAKVLLTTYTTLLALLLLAYLILKIRPMTELLGFILFFELISRLLEKPLLNLPNSNVIWYVAWMTIFFITMWFVLRVAKKYPSIQKIAIPVAMLFLIDIVINLARYVERHYTEFDIVKGIYGPSSNGISILILAYLFAPIALLLVKSIRGRISAKH